MVYDTSLCLCAAALREYDKTGHSFPAGYRRQTELTQTVTLKLQCAIGLNLADIDVERLDTVCNLTRRHTQEARGFGLNPSSLF